MFTVKQIENLKAKDKSYQVREGKGFGIRVFPSGEKTWFFAYKFHGRQRTMTLGGFPDLKLSEARELFRSARNLLAKGKDPLEERQQEANAGTVKQMIDDFLASPTKKGRNRAQRTVDEYRRSLEKDVIKKIGTYKVHDVTEDHITAILTRILDRGSKNQALQVYKALRAAFTWAAPRKKYKLKYNPFALVERPAADNKKSRVFTEDEIRAFWTELDVAGMSEPIKQALRLILVTGQRPGEVIGMHCDEVDGCWWTIPANRAKNRKEHRVYLSPLAQSLIAMLPQDGYLFPSRGNTGKHVAVNALAHAVRRNSAWAQKQPQEGRFYFSIEDPWTPHDLRRSCATGLGSLGYTDELIGHVLNHTRPGVTSIYNRYLYDTEKQQALEAWGRKLENLIVGRHADNVINFHQRGQ